MVIIPILQLETLMLGQMSRSSESDKRVVYLISGCSWMAVRGDMWPWQPG